MYICLCTQTSKKCSALSSLMSVRVGYSENSTSQLLHSACNGYCIARNIGRQYIGWILIWWLVVEIVVNDVSNTYLGVHPFIFSTDIQ